jgi:hypothetical protein
MKEKKYSWAEWQKIIYERHPKINQRIIEEQIAQNSSSTVGVIGMGFDSASTSDGGFAWCDSEEEEVWNIVLLEQDVLPFYEFHKLTTPATEEEIDCPFKVGDVLQCVKSGGNNTYVGKFDPVRVKDEGFRVKKIHSWGLYTSKGVNTVETECGKFLWASTDYFKLVDEAKSDGKFKVGDKVRIRKDSAFYYSEYYFNNPRDEDGVITGIAPRGCLDIMVEWKNGSENSYSEKDLELADGVQYQRPKTPSECFKSVETPTQIPTVKTVKSRRLLADIPQVKSVI